MKEIFVGMIIGGSLMLFAMSLASVNSKNTLIEENKQLKDENSQLKKDNKQLENNNSYFRCVERRSTEYARKIKKIEDIIFGKGTIVSKHDALEKFLKGEK